MTADKQLKAYVDRVLRLKEEQDTLGDDIREIYAEAKNDGYDKTIMGKLVAHLRKVAKSGEDAISEQADIFDTYLTAYRRASGTALATHTHEENYDRQTGEVLDDITPGLAKQIVDGMQTEAGRAALIAAVDIMIEREEAEDESRAKASGEQTEGTTGLQAAGPRREMRVGEAPALVSATSDDGRDSVERHAPNSPSDDDAISEVNGNAGLENATGVEPSSSAPSETPSFIEAAIGILAEDTRSEANTGGDHVTAPGTAAQHNPGRGLVSNSPATFILRPNCRQPDSCGGYGANHCHACKVAARELETA